MRVVLIDDDPGILQAFAALLPEWGVEVDTYRIVPSFVPPCDVVLLDLDLRATGGMDGTDTLEHALSVFTAHPIIILTGNASPDDHARCVDMGAHSVIEKPAPTKQIVSAIKQAHAAHNRVIGNPRRTLARIERLQAMAMGG